MENYDEIFDNGTYGSAQPRLSTEEWIEMKKQERAELYAAIDDMAEKALCDKEALSTYLTLQANLGRTSVNNTLLVMAQKPDATFVCDAEVWQERGRGIRKGEGKNAIKQFMQDKEYTREDGSVAMGYKVVRCFDISQTYGKPVSQRAALSMPMKSKLKALMTDAPVPVKLTDDVPPSVGALYSPKENAIHVAKGLDGGMLFYTETLFTIGSGRLCQFATLKYQQLEGLKTVLPYGVRKIDALRTLTTESAAVFIPFRVQEVFHNGGVYYGKNAISGNMIIVNKSELMNGSALRFGVPGSGKSFGAKDEMEQLALNTDDDILVCDPEREYTMLEKFGGEIIRIAAGSPDHINAMDMVEGYSDVGSPVAQKSQFVMSLLEQLDQEHELSSKDKSIIDRCTGDLYKNYRHGGPLPTLLSLRELLLAQPEPEARDLALSLELFTKGSLNAFAYPTNVNTNSRIVVYDILDLGEQLKTMGLLVITDAILNRVTENWKKGKRTHVYLDEFHVVYENPYSSMFFTSAWRRFRKRNAFPTGITQNVEYLLDNASARSLLSNSELIVMHNQASSDRERLAELFNISEDQMKFITNAEAGHGLMKIGKALIPFVNRFPRNLELYRYMTTKPGETEFWG